MFAFFEFVLQHLDRTPSHTAFELHETSFVEKELRRRSVTRLLLWKEYRAANPDGFGYTWFCTTFDAWKQRARPSMRQTHVGGGKRYSSISPATPSTFLIPSRAKCAP